MLRFSLDDLQQLRDDTAQQIDTLTNRLAEYDQGLALLERLAKAHTNGNGAASHGLASAPSAELPFFDDVKALLRAEPMLTRGELLDLLVEGRPSSANNPRAAYQTAISGLLRKGLLRHDGSRFVITRRRHAVVVDLTTNGGDSTNG
jgi:hypothetical protein